MKVFIIGPSKIGKTTYANKIKKEAGFDASLSMSFLLKEQYKQNNNESDLQYIERLSKISTDILKEYPDYFVHALKQEIRMNGYKNIVIDGVRNPFDFAKLYENGDSVIFVSGDDYSYKSSFEEQGLIAIAEMLNFMSHNMMSEQDQHHYFGKYEFMENQIRKQAIIEELKIKMRI